MLSFDLKDIVAYIQDKWYQPQTLILILVIVPIILLVAYFSLIKPSIPGNVFILTFSKILFMCVLFDIPIIPIWLYTTRLPTSPKNNIGFAVALLTDNKKQQELISKDLVRSLGELLLRSNHKYDFFLLELPNYFSGKIKTAEDAKMYLKSTHCKFMIYGAARVRNVEGKETHVLNMEGVVAHAPIPEYISKQFSKEFTEVFPRKLLLASENDMLEFELTSEWVNVVAKYIIGIASMLSGDIDYSQTLFEELERDFKCIPINKSNAIPAICKIKKRIPDRILDVYLAQTRFASEKWRQTRDPELLETIRTYSDKIRAVSPDNFAERINRAILCFAINRDTAVAKSELRQAKRCKDKNDAICAYNLAFIYAYEGNMKRATKLYKKAFSGEIVGHKIIEIEEFICWILEEEPVKTQLYFCVGLINYFAKNDKSRALDDFTSFIKLTPDGEFPEEQNKAQEYINDILSKKTSSPKEM